MNEKLLTMLEECIKITEKNNKKEMPRTPILQEVASTRYHCPTCRAYVQVGYKYCPYCMQKLDWSANK